MAFPVARSGRSQWTVTLQSPDGTGVLCTLGTLTSRPPAAVAPPAGGRRHGGPGAGVVLVQPLGSSLEGQRVAGEGLGGQRRQLTAPFGAQGHRPKMVMEYWTGWFDSWGGPHYILDSSGACSVGPCATCAGLRCRTEPQGGGQWCDLAAVRRSGQLCTWVAAERLQSPLSQQGKERPDTSLGSL